MSAWLLSIVGVVSLGVLIEIIMPEGEHSKYIKGIFSLIVVFVIVAPFPKLFSQGDFAIFENNEVRQTQMDEESYDALTQSYREKYRERFDELLSEQGIDGIEYSLNYDERYVFKATEITVKGFYSLSQEQQNTLEDLIEGYFGSIEVQTE